MGRDHSLSPDFFAGVGIAPKQAGASEEGPFGGAWDQGLDCDTIENDAEHLNHRRQSRARAGVRQAIPGGWLVGACPDSTIGRILPGYGF